MEDKPLTPAQLAERYGVTEWTLWDWRKRGVGPRWFKVSNRVFYSQKDIEAYEAKQKEARDAG